MAEEAVREVTIRAKAERTGEPEAIAELAQDLRSLEPAAAAAAQAVDEASSASEKLQLGDAAQSVAEFRSHLESIEPAASAATRGMEEVDQAAASLESAVTGTAESLSELEQAAQTSAAAVERLGSDSPAANLQKIRSLVDELRSGIDQLDSKGEGSLGGFARAVAKVQLQIAELRAELSRVGDESLPEIRAELAKLEGQFQDSFSKAAQRARDLAGAVDRVNDELREVERGTGSVDRLGKAFGSLQGILAGLGIGIGLHELIQVGRKVVESAVEQEGALTQLNQAISSTGGRAGVTAEKIRSVASSLEQLTLAEDDTIIKLATLLLSFENLGESIFPQLIESALNVAERLDTDLQGALLQLGKALNSPIEGLKSLAKIGVQFTADQEKLIEALVQSGNILEAQQIILDQLETKYGGAARAAKETFGGSLETAGKQAGELTEALASGLSPALEKLAKDFTTAAAGTTSFAGRVGQVLGSLLIGVSALIKGLEASAATVGLLVQQLFKPFIEAPLLLLEFAPTVLKALGADKLAPALARDLEHVRAVWDDFNANLQGQLVNNLRTTGSLLEADWETIAKIWSAGAKGLQTSTEQSFQAVRKVLDGALKDTAAFSDKIEKALELNPKLDLKKFREDLGEQLTRVQTATEAVARKISELSFSPRLDLKDLEKDLAALQKRKKDIEELAERIELALKINPSLDLKTFDQVFNQTREKLLKDAEALKERLDIALKIAPTIDLKTYSNLFQQELQNLVNRFAAAGEQLPKGFEPFLKTLKIVPDGLQKLNEDVKQFLGQLPGVIAETAAEVQEKGNVLREALKRLGGEDGFDVNDVWRLKPETREALKKEVEELVNTFRQLKIKIDPEIAAAANSLGVLVGAWETAAESTKTSSRTAAEAIQSSSQSTAESALAQKKSIEEVIVTTDELGNKMVTTQKITAEAAKKMTLEELEQASPNVRAYAEALKKADQGLGDTGKAAKDAAGELKKPGDSAGETSKAVGDLVEQSKKLDSGSKAVAQTLGAEAGALDRLTESANKVDLDPLAQKLRDLAEIKFAEGIVSELQEIRTETATLRTEVQGLVNDLAAVNRAGAALDAVDAKVPPQPGKVP